LTRRGNHWLEELLRRIDHAAAEAAGGSWPENPPPRPLSPADCARWIALAGDADLLAEVGGVERLQHPADLAAGLVRQLVSPQPAARLRLWLFAALELLVDLTSAASAGGQPRCVDVRLRPAHGNAAERTAAERALAGSLIAQLLPARLRLGPISYETP
jgi:hypothetical protein